MVDPIHAQHVVIKYPFLKDEYEGNIYFSILIPCTLDERAFASEKISTHVLLLGFTLGAKFVSSKHLIQVHLEILSCSVENMASHLLTKYIT